MAAFTAFEVRRDDLRKTCFREAEVPAPAPGQALLRVDRFALTANNVTYAVAGESMSYWKFFPAAEPGHGRIPVWGFADVERSSAPGLAAGERLYGYFPIATHLVIEPGSPTPGGVADVSTHRAGLPPIYNQYRRVAADPGYDAALEDHQAVLQPLFMTGFLLADQLGDERFYGARRVLIGSASSKTAIALARQLARAGACEVVGLTSARNAKFVAELGCYERVVRYDELDGLPADAPAAFVDMANDTAVTDAVHRRLGDGLRASILVGITHWETPPRTAPPPGPAPQLFFAPSRVEKRIADWGARGLQERMGAAWREFVDWTRGWLEIERGHGRTDVERVYRATLEGQARPDRGYVLALKE
jgi:NADPH:quinone reductase-like Zn-dependent oxidoreductase